VRLRCEALHELAAFQLSANLRAYLAFLGGFLYNCHDEAI
jgi:hypothetical protein